MDPGLASLIESGSPEDEVAVLVRLVVPRQNLPDWVRVVAMFGDIATIRLTRGTLQDLRAHDVVHSVKAPTLFWADDMPVSESPGDPAPLHSDIQRRQRRPEGVTLTGRGVVVGVVDWGLDFTHPAFRHPDGTTRVLALWDQQPGPDRARPNRYGYGRIYRQAEIDDALTRDDPFSALSYFPWLSDTGGGAHGTATSSIAAGSDWPGGIPGVAPDADIVFVHASTWGSAGPQSLGDSVALAEALDFIRDISAGKPCVTNLSLGAHGGPHDGSTLLERAMDAFVLEQPGRMIVQSCGNYFASDTHTGGELLAGEQVHLPIEIDEETATIHEVDVWYSGADRMTVGIIGPGGNPRALTRPGQHGNLEIDGSAVGEIRHRVDDPNDGRNHAVVHLADTAPAGTWQLVLQAVDVVDGRFHAWIEREAVHPSAQVRFNPPQAVATTTTGTICNGYRTISVGAYDAHDPLRRVAAFSSSGPTVDGRRKPDLIAPGVRVLAARSRPAYPDYPDQPPEGTEMSGTSMAAPHVTGTVACLYQHQPLSASALRSALLETCELHSGGDLIRAGNGYLNIAVAAQSLTPATEVSHRNRRGRSPYAQHVAPGQGTSLEGRGVDMTQDVAGQGTAFMAETASCCGDDSVRSDEPPTALPRTWSARELVDAFVLDNNPALRRRLADQFEMLYGPYEQVAHSLRAGDFLIRAALGEGHTTVAVLEDGRLLGHDDATERGWALEGGLPGRYALVTRDSSQPTFAGDRFARRITDRRGELPAGQALIRPRTAPLRTVSGNGVVGLPGEQPALIDLSNQFVGSAAGDRPGRTLMTAAAPVNLLVESVIGPCADVPITAAARPVLLIRGSIHPAVRDAQRRMNVFHISRAGAGLSGIDGAPLVEDCIFGAGTERALISFQQIVFPGRLTEHDGRLGPKTWAQFDRVATPLPTPTPLPLPTPPVVPAPGPPSPALSGPRSVSRPCCMLNSLSLAGASTHGNHSASQPGIVYTGGAGFVDFGHLWEVCDVTAWAYQQIHAGTGAVGTTFDTGEGTVRITSPAPSSEWLLLARAIAFDEALAHEISTYTNFTPGGHNSSFSPEDLCSNFLGTLVAERALIAGGPFPAEAENQARLLLASLAAQDDAQTSAAFAKIGRRWVDTSLVGTIARDGYLRRRNFTRDPWKVGHPSDATTPSFVVAPVTLNLRYEYTHKANGFTKATMPAEIAAIKADALRRYGPDFDKP